MKENYTVYEHIAPNGKVYVGITSMRPEKRWGSEGNRYSDQKLFSKAIKKYGWDNFQHKIILDHQTKSEACYAEKYLIRYYKARKMSYNAANGGELNEGWHLSPVVKKHLSLIHIGNTICVGRHHTDESKRKISEGHKGIHHTDESKRKMSEGHKGIIPWIKGRHHTEEAKRKISEANKGKCTLSEEGRKRISEANKNRHQTIEAKQKLHDSHIHTGILILIDNKIYSIPEASYKFDLNATNIRKQLKKSDIISVTSAKTHQTHTITIVTK